MSPRELAREFKAAGLKREDEYNRDVQLAWNVMRVELLTDAVPKIRKLPDVTTLLLNYRPRVLTRADHHAQQLAVFKDVSVRYGITLRTKES